MLWEAKVRPGEVWPYWGRYLGRISCWDYIPEGMVPTRTRLVGGAIHQLLTTPVRIEGHTVWFSRRGLTRPAPGSRGARRPPGPRRLRAICGARGTP
jgi:hypothetical protein